MAWYESNGNNGGKLEVLTASGDIASFETNLGLPLQSVLVNVLATGGNGTPDSPIPVNGYTEANITANGDTFTITFGQTVYGGVLDVTRGKLRVTYAETLIKNLSWTKSTSSNKRFYTLSVASTIKRPPTQNNVGDCLCEIGSPISANYLYSNHDGIAINTNGEIWLYFTDYVDKTEEEMITDLGDYKLVYELATPFDIDLTPVQIRALVGVNNVFADCGETEVKYLYLE